MVVPKVSNILSCRITWFLWWVWKRLVTACLFGRILMQKEFNTPWLIGLIWFSFFISLTERWYINQNRGKTAMGQVEKKSYKRRKSLPMENHNEHAIITEEFLVVRAPEEVC